MKVVSATDVRREWSAIIDSVARDKPLFFRRKRDELILLNVETFKIILSVFNLTAEKYTEDDGSITLSLNEIPLVENGGDEQAARLLLGKGLHDFSKDYYNDFKFWTSAPNSKAYLPYVMKVLIMDNEREIGESIICQDVKN